MTDKVQLQPYFEPLFALKRKVFIYVWPYTRIGLFCIFLKNAGLTATSHHFVREGRGASYRGTQTNQVERFPASLKKERARRNQE